MTGKMLQRKEGKMEESIIMGDDLRGGALKYRNI